MDPDYFYADRGPTTVERNDPMFLLQKSCCWWSGQSWPYATTQTLKAMANLLQNYDQKFVTRADYLKLLHNYALSHRKDGRPYLAEALHPDTGSFEGHDAYNHSEHYFHSGFCDLVITGLVGLQAAGRRHARTRPARPAGVGLLRAGRRAVPRPPPGDRLGPDRRALRPGRRPARAGRRQGNRLVADARQADASKLPAGCRPAAAARPRG